MRMAGRASRQSFERRLKRKGIQVDTLSSAAVDKSAKLASFKGLEFWIWDKVEHERKYNEWIQDMLGELAVTIIR